MVEGVALVDKCSIYSLKATFLGQSPLTQLSRLLHLSGKISFDRFSYIHLTDSPAEMPSCDLNVSVQTCWPPRIRVFTKCLSWRTIINSDIYLMFLYLCSLRVCQTAEAVMCGKCGREVFLAKPKKVWILISNFLLQTQLQMIQASFFFFFMNN